MSKALNGYQTRIVWGLETSIGTEVTPDVLWLSNESDSLVFGDVPIDFTEAFTGARGAKSAQLRAGNYGPTGELGEAPVYLDGSSTDFLEFCTVMFQNSARGTYNAGSAIYTFTFTQSTSQIDSASIRSMTVLKDTGMGAGKNPVFAGAVIDSCTWSWDFGGAIMQKPTLYGLSGREDGTAPSDINSPSQGFMQAPNIAVTFNGSAIYPVGWAITLNNNIAPVPGPSTDAYRTYSYGQATGEVELKVWRDDSSFFSDFVSSYNDETVGTLVITASVDTSYGSFSDGSAYRAIWTVYVRTPERPEMAMTRGEMVDTIKLQTIYDTYPSIVVPSVRTTVI